MLDQERVQRIAETITAGRTGLMPFGPTGPVCTVNQSIYTAFWSASGKGVIDGKGTAPATVILDFDFVNTERRTGETHCELRVDFADPVDPLMQFRTRLNLTSLRARSELAKQLAARSSQPMDWIRMLDQAVQWVMSQHRSGEPAVFLPDAEEPEAGLTSPLPPLLATDGATIFFGDGGASKSYLALAVAASLQSNDSIIPNLHPTRMMRVAYLDWEWSAYVHKRRLAKLLPGTRSEILYVPCRLPLKEERDRLRHIIRKHSVEFLILDSVALAAGGEPESAEVAVGFFSILRELALPSLLIAHVTNAAAKGQADRPFGSAFWHNSARSTWYIKRSEDVIQTNTLTVALLHRKANDEARSPAIGLQWHYEPESTWIERVDVGDDPSLEGELPVRLRIELFLRGGAKPIHEIADSLDLVRDTVAKTLKRGQGKHFVQMPGKGGQPALWALASRQTS